VSQFTFVQLSLKQFLSKNKTYGNNDLSSRERLFVDTVHVHNVQIETNTSRRGQGHLKAWAA